MLQCISKFIATAIILASLLPVAQSEPMPVAEIRDRVEANYTSAIALYRNS